MSDMNDMQRPPNGCMFREEIVTEREIDPRTNKPMSHGFTRSTCIDELS